MGIRGRIEDEKGRGIPAAEVFVQEVKIYKVNLMLPLISRHFGMERQR